MTFKMYAVDFCELVLFDEQKQALHLMMHSFDKEVALDALVGSVSQSLPLSLPLSPPSLSPHFLMHSMCNS